MTREPESKPAIRDNTLFHTKTPLASTRNTDIFIGPAPKENVRPAHVEGLSGGRWVLLDYIDFVVHVFHPQSRDFYQLENLWGDAPRWEPAQESSPLQ